MKQHSFEKFINKEKGSKKKEAFRQEKRKWREERNKKFQVKSLKSNIQNPKSEIIYSGNKKTENRKLKTEIRKLETGNHQPATEIPLNKFIAHAGICSRREAADLVKEGKIKVNGDFVYEPGYKVHSNDKIAFNNKPLHLQKNLVY
ncbi:MAG TPA: S4 domain-containing protein, partial [Parafilimonas sp.]|nr:S4 domain-containing protein [Parafilimonas sp.]